MTALLLMGVGVMKSQTVTGTVVDSETKEPIVGSVVTITGTEFKATTDDNGRFKIDADATHNIIMFECLGYEALEQNIVPGKGKHANLKKGASVNLGVVELVLDAQIISDVIVSSSIGLARKTPVAMSNLNKTHIEEKLGGQEFPEVLKPTPGVYATKSGGGFGDSKINMRGFQSANVAVMVNGVPMNDMEWGGVYWSNWAGLSDVSRIVQTQRGLGASKVSAPSVGGTINIITRTIDSEKGGSFVYGMGNDGSNNVSLTLSTGLTKGGWGMTVMGGKSWGDGYVQGTEFEVYNYFLSVYKRFGTDHTLSFTAFGSPQKHNQRSSYDGLSVEGWQKAANYMAGRSPYRYNPTYGFGMNGERKSSTVNYYHKPQLSLNYQWDINPKSSLSAVLYMSRGYGYGTTGQGIDATYSNYWYGASNGTLNMKFRHGDGTYAYDEVQKMNEASDHGSLMVMADGRNDHYWYGLLSTFTHQLKPEINSYVGVDLRCYKGVHATKISDLYNGAYFTDLRYRSNVDPANNYKAADPMWKYEKLGIGDVVYRDYDSHVEQAGVFAQMEYTKMENLSAFVSGSVSNSRYWRVDRFYYDAAHAKSQVLNFLGYTVKGGANYNLDAYQNVFANLGYISRAPFFSGGVFLMSHTSNEANPDAVNEKAFSAELGYGFKNNWVKVDVNAYYTLWMDKTTTRWGNLDQSNDRYIMNMEGVDAKHVGLELDAVVKPAPWIDIKAMVSLGNWKWNSNATAYFYNSESQPLSNLSTGEIASAVGAPDHVKFTLNQKGVHVGGSAQTTMSLGLTFRPTKEISVGADYTYYARNYADFTLPSYTASNEFTLQEPWKIPDAGQLDLNARYKFKLGGCNATLIANINNVLDYEYIMDAFYDGTNNRWQDAYRVFYSFGRTFSVKVKLDF